MGFFLLNRLLGTDTILVHIESVAEIGVCSVLLAKVNISIFCRLFCRGV